MPGLISGVRTMLRLQREILSVAWRARRSETALAALVRLKNEMWPYLPANTLPVRSVDELFPGIVCHVQLRERSFDPQHRHYYRVYMHQVCVLAAIAAHIRPKRIFEFGTDRGTRLFQIAQDGRGVARRLRRQVALDLQVERF